MKDCSILLSHLPTQCCGSDLPIKMLREIMQFFRENELRLISSCGNTHWNLILTSAICVQVPVKLVCEKGQEKNWNYNFDEIVFVENNDDRDQKVCEISDIIFPVWVRKNGRLAKITVGFCGKTDRRFDHSDYKFNEKAKYDIPDCGESIKSVPSNYIWHWTHISLGAWAGESDFDFCAALLDSSKYPRTAFDTLLRILRDKKIRASNKHIARKTPVVCFSENHPSQMKTMLQWRAKSHRMNFEPYSIGIPQNTAVKMGVEKITYGGELSWNTMKNENTVWKSENEWRYLGDFILNEEVWENMILIVKERCEIEKVKPFFEGEILSYYGSNIF